METTETVSFRSALKKYTAVSTERWYKMQVQNTSATVNGLFSKKQYPDVYKNLLLIHVIKH